MGKTIAEEERKNAMLRARVTADEKKAFIAKGRALGFETESEFLISIVRKAIADETTEAVQPVARNGETSVRELQLHVGVNEQMALDVRARAIASGERYVSRYLYRMLRAHLSKDASFTEKELNELRLGRNELTSLGRNISQIAKVLNAAPNQLHVLKALALEDVAEAIRTYRDSVGRLIRANLSAWGVEHHDEQV